MSLKQCCQNIITARGFIVGTLVISMVLVLVANLSLIPFDNFNDNKNNYVVHEVWHHSQTVGVLGFTGKNRLLEECTLILIEGK